MFELVRRNMAALLMMLALVVGLAGEAAAIDVAAGKGLFARGKVRGSLHGGYASVGEEDYFVLGFGLGYNVADGLTAGVDYETWLNEPTVNKLSPWIGYTFWQVPLIKPYVSGFLRQTWVDTGDDAQHVGGRVGVFLPRGRSWLGVGLVYEHRLDGGFGDRDQTYPEVSLMIGF